MNKTDMIEHMAKHADISKAAAGRALEAFMMGVRTNFKKGGLGDAGRLWNFCGHQTRSPFGPQPSNRRDNQNQVGEATKVSSGQSL